MFFYGFKEASLEGCVVCIVQVPVFRFGDEVGFFAGQCDVGLEVGFDTAACGKINGFVSDALKSVLDTP